MTWARVADLVEALLPGDEIVLELEPHDGTAVTTFSVEVSADGAEITIGFGQRRATKAMRAHEFARVLRRSAAATAVQ